MISPHLHKGTDMGNDNYERSVPPEVFRSRMLWREAFQIAGLLRDPTTAGMGKIANSSGGADSDVWVLGALMLADCVHDIGSDLPTLIRALELFERGGGTTSKLLDCHPAQASPEETNRRLTMLKRVLLPSAEDIERRTNMIKKLEEVGRRLDLAP